MTANLTGEDFMCINEWARGRKLYWLAPLLALSLWIHFQGALWGDKAFMLTYSGMWLHGKKAYIDLFELQPPSTLWLYAFPVFLSEHIPLHFLSDGEVLVVLTLLLLSAVTRLSIAILYYSPAFPDRQSRIWSGLLLFSVLTLYTMPNYFGDREHVFLILVFPYILRWLPSLDKALLPLRIRIIIGVLAGLGFCMKPHCLILLFGLQLILILRKKPVIMCLENRIIVIILLLYGLAVAMFTPEYLTVVMPMALATYGVINQWKQGLLYGAGALLVAGVSFADFRPRYTSPYRQDIMYLALCSLPLIVYALANNGWGYTWNLVFSMLFITTGLMLLEYRFLRQQYAGEPSSLRQITMGYRACVLNLSVNAAYCLFVSGFILAISCGDLFECTASKDFLNRAILANDGKKIDSFGTLSMKYMEWAKFSRATGAKWDTRFHQLFMLPKFFVADEAFHQNHQWILNYVSQAYAHDLAVNKPDIIFVDDTDDFYSIHHYVDLVAYMEQFPEFREAWKHYVYVTKLEITGNPHQDNAHSGYYLYKRLQ